MNQNEFEANKTVKRKNRKIIKDSEQIYNMQGDGRIQLFFKIRLSYNVPLSENLKDVRIKKFTNRRLEKLMVSAFEHPPVGENSKYIR